MNAESKTYLGDSVYAEFDGFGVTLTTENGAAPSNTIYLEPQIIALLNSQLEHWRKAVVQN